MKKSWIFSLLAIVSLASCQSTQHPLVDVVFADSLIQYYKPSERATTTDSNLVFWERRMAKQPDNFVNGPKYAGALTAAFQVHGDIDKLLKADSLMQKSNEANQQKEAGIFRTLASLAITQHRFREADSLIQKAILIEGRSFPNLAMDFDVAFENGDYAKAKKQLQAISIGNTYAYLFRRSKFEHYEGSLDTAINCMLRAVDKAANNKYLQQAALSNAADLYIHKGSLKAAAALYKKSILIDAADFHSILGLGWIALQEDKNDSLAERVFRFVDAHSLAPDALLKLEQLYEARNDSNMQKKYALQFVDRVKDAKYGRMYNKYLVDLYTGILNNPAKAVALSLEEIVNRPTPQVYAWYAWSLFCNKETDKAYSIFKSHVSGSPLEGPELYYMGKMMKGLNKGYNAQEFFKVAWKNRYDLSPAKIKDIQENLE